VASLLALLALVTLVLKIWVEWKDDMAGVLNLHQKHRLRSKKDGQ
jgi:ABC-type sulfate transport system permease subunit